MPSFVFSNNCNTTLAAPITTTGQTTITLASSAHLPTLTGGQTFALTLNDAATQSVFEVLYVTAIAGANLTVLRGQEGTAATTWLTGDFAYGALTAGELANFLTTGAAYVDLTTNQTIGGIKTFSVPPIASGAGLQTGTVPTAALVSTILASLHGLFGVVDLTSPDSSILIGVSGNNITLQNAGAGIGQTAMNSSRLPNSSGTYSVAVTYTLPAGTWKLKGQAFFDLGGGNMAITGSGAHSTWESTSTTTDTGGPEMVQLQGSSTGGDTPGVSLTISGSSGGIYAGLLEVWAVRVA